MNEPKSLIPGDDVQSTDTLPTTRVFTPAEIEAMTGLKRPRWQFFVAEYVSGGNRTAAAIKAGYAPRRANNAGYRLAREPAIEKALAIVRKALAERTGFHHQTAMDQLKQDREYARQTDNAAAAVRATELMAKMAGHLVERVDARIQSVPFHLHIGGIDDEVAP
jgi:phage terminase small subunit